MLFRFSKKEIVIKKNIILILLGVFISGISLVQAGGFEDWCALYGISADPEGDPDGDGSDNLFEYAYAGDPTNSVITGIVPKMRLVEDGGSYYVETERLELRNQNPDDGWNFYEVFVTDDLEYGMWEVVVCSEVSRGRYGVSAYDLVILRTPIPVDGGGWTPSRLFYRESGNDIYAFMGGVYFGSVERTHYTYPFAEYGSRMIGDILGASAWDYLEITEGDGLVSRVDWNSATGEWDDPTVKLPQAGYGFTGWRTENADFLPNCFGKVIPYESVDIYCPKGETLIGNPYPKDCLLNEFVSNPTEGDTIDIWDSTSLTYIRSIYTEGSPPFFPAGWVDSQYNQVGDLLYIAAGQSVRYTTSEPKVLTFQSPFSEYFQGSADQTFLALSEREISCTTGTASATFFAYTLGGGDTLSYTVSNDVPWISCSPSSGTTSGEHDAVSLTFDASGLSVGTYTGYVSVVSVEAANSPQKVQVVMEVVEVVFESVSISGATTVVSGSTNGYVCTAHYTGGGQSNVTGATQWSVSGTAASIDASGKLIAGQVDIQESVTVSASYTDGEITKTDTFDVVVKNPNVELDYSYIGGPANPLILSNQTFVGSSGNDAAGIGQIPELEVYDCSFIGGEKGGAGLSMQDVDSVFMISPLTGCVAQGGDGANVENLEPDAELEAIGGDGIEYSGNSLNITFENITAVGGNGGLVRSVSVVAMEGDASGGWGVFVDAEDSLGEHLIRFDGGRYEGGAGGSCEGLFNDAYVWGGDGVVVCGSTNGSVLISEGVFVGGSGGFAFDGSGEADGGSGFVLEVGIATFSGGMFTGGQSGLASSANGGHGVYAYDSDIGISGGSFMGGAAYDAISAGSGVWLDNSSADISGGDFAGEEYGGKLSVGLRMDSSSADISGGNFDSICFSSGGNSATFSGSPMIETLLQIDGTGDIVLSGFSGSIETARVEGGTMTVSGDTWALVSGSEIEITEVATLLVGELHALSGSQITTEIGATFAGTNLTFESGCEWTIDAHGAGVTGVVELAMAVNLVSSLAPADLTLLGDGSTYVSSVITSNSTLYAILEEIPVGFDAWVEGITNVNLRGHADCPDGDGVANLLKYACGFPSGSFVSNLFDFAVFPATLTNSTYVTITYRKTKNLLDADVYPIQTGTLLGNDSQWTSDGINPWKSGEENGVEIWRASMHGVTNGFIRLKVEALSLD